MVRADVDLVADIGEVLLEEDAIQARVAELAAQISADYSGRQLTLVSVLKGPLPFMADLMRHITIPLRIDLMEVSSYGGTATESSGLVRILKDLSSSIDGSDVLLVEDIIDTGLTLNYLLRYLRDRGYGLAAYVFTNDLSVAWKMAEGLEAGIIGINDPVPSTPQCPFGGMKESGLGRELAHEGLEAYLETKYISFKLRD